MARVKREQQTATLCPKCEGQGHVNKPPWIPGDQTTWVSSTTGSYECRVCKGEGVLWQ